MRGQLPLLNEWEVNGRWQCKMHIYGYIIAKERGCQKAYNEQDSIVGSKNLLSPDYLYLDKLQLYQFVLWSFHLLPDLRSRVVPV